MSETTFARREREGFLGIVTLTNPRYNTLHRQVFLELSEALRALDEDPEVRVILLCAEGEHFSYGLDLKRAMAEMGPAFAEGGMASARLALRTYIHELQEAVQTPGRLKKPVIAAIQGYCIGGALELVLACDLRVASQDARFTLKEVQIGIVADLGGLQRLPLVVGEARARELALTGREVLAEEAERIGLVHRLYPDGEGLQKGARELARSIAELPPLAVQGVKQVLNQRLKEQIQAGLDYVALWNSAFLVSQDLLEALNAFVEKRPPRFTGR